MQGIYYKIPIDFESLTEKKDAEKKVKIYSKEAFRRNEYLKEKNLTEKYENWVENKQVRIDNSK